VMQEGLRDLAAGGVAGAEEEHARPRRAGGRPGPIAQNTTRTVLEQTCVPASQIR
jgi:hypothetical protein